MTDDFYSDPGAIRGIQWATWLKGAVCVALVVLLGAALWFRWVPGRPVPPEWARGNASPDNSLSYEVEEDLPSSIAGDVEAVSAPSFVFTMGEGSGAAGFDVIQVWPSGRCEYTYPEASELAANGLTSTSRPATAPALLEGDLVPWRRARLAVDPQVVADLRRLLVDIDYFNLKRSYRAPAAQVAAPPVIDKTDPVMNKAPLGNGRQWFVRVHAGAHEKGVWCDNHFPRQIIGLNDFVRTRIVEPNATARSLAVPIDLPPNWLPELQIAPTAADDKPSLD